MVQKLEAIKGGGGSIKIGTTGTIGALMTRELENTETVPATPVQCLDRLRTIPVLISRSATTPRRLQAIKSLNEASSNGTSSSSNHRSLETPGKDESFAKSGTHRVPMLASQGATLERTPSREKLDKRGTNIVEFVDIKMWYPNRPWATPITTKLKKLGFLKLSESVV